MAAVLDFIITLLTIAIFTRVILSFIVPIMGSPPPFLVNLQAVVIQLTEPILAPVRRILPSFGNFDFSPMIVLIILWAVREVLVTRL